MTRRRPLVANGGNLAELPASDTLAGASRVLVNGTETPELDIDPTPVTASTVGASRVLVNGVYDAELDIDPTPITPASIGAQPADSDLTALAALDSAAPGVIGSTGLGWVTRTWAQVRAALATGTASGTTFLRGDGVWATPASGSSDLRGFGVHYASQYGAPGDGSDQTTALQTALAALPVGGKLILDADGSADYAITAPLVVPPGRTLRGGYTSTLLYPGNATADPPAPCTIRVLAGFVGPAAVRLLGKTAGGYTTASSIGHRVENLTINGANGPAGVAGVQLYGFVREARLDQVTVRRVTGNGFDAVEDPAATTEQSRFPQSLRLYGCVADNVGGAGFSLVNVPDTTIVDCNAQGSGWVGFNLAGIPNGIVTSCRAEWSGAHGFLITSGYWGTGQGSGGLQLVGCLTDRNGQNGVHVDAQGGHTVTLVGCTHRRDGRSAVDAGYAGVFVTDATTLAVDITATSIKPGVGDSGEGNLSPQFGVSATSAGIPVTVTSGVVHGATGSVSAGARLIIAPNVAQLAGTVAAPTRGSVSRPASRIELLSNQPWGPADFGLVAYTAPPLTSSGTTIGAGTIRLTRIRVPVATPVTALTTVVATLGAGLTTGQNFLALYDTAFTRLGVTADQTTAWGTLGEARANLVTPITSLPAGDYYVAHLFNGTTSPTFLSTFNGYAGLVGRTGTAALGLVDITGRTVTPATATPTASGNGIWAGIAA